MLAILCMPALAQDGIEVRDAWVRAAPPGAMSLAGYLSIDNGTDGDVRLTDVSSADFGMIMLHTTVIEDGVARMLHLDGLDVPARGTVRLAPGGTHMMLMHPKRALREGDTVDFRFGFSDGRVKEVTAGVSRDEPAGADTGKK